MTAARHIAITVRNDAWAEALPDADRLCRRAARVALDAARADGTDVAPGAKIGVVLADDAAVRALNLRYRGLDRPTNVLAFPQISSGNGAAPTAEGAPELLGDAIVALETAVAEAAAQAKPLADHVAHLVVHGTLHLVGYAHDTDADAGRMEGLEIAALADLGIADPYGADPVVGVAGAST